MKTTKLAWSCVALAASVQLGCAMAHDLDAPAAGDGSSAVSGAGLTLPEDCLETNRAGIAPKQLRCTGLYTDVAEKKVQDSVREFVPAIPFWSDGADKRRWVFLPPGEQIDTSDPNAWDLPVGTRFFKEFKVKGRRVETRLYFRESESRWIKASYRWNDDETEATRFVGGEFMFAGEPYYIPSAEECDKCHKGSGNDRSLGFEAILLGLPGAKGVTLDLLREEGRLSDPDTMPEDLEIGDDGTGAAAKALGWMHSNCGISCHSADSATEAFRTGLRLRLDVNDLDGRSATEFEAYQTVVGKPATVERWLGADRIVPGNTNDSLLYWLISRRDPTNPANAMPPLATAVPDADGVRAVQTWIRLLGQGSTGNSPF